MLNIDGGCPKTDYNMLIRGIKLLLLSLFRKNNFFFKKSRKYYLSDSLFYNK